jgi:hypothetical protein
MFRLIIPLMLVLGGLAIPGTAEHTTEVSLEILQ